MESINLITTFIILLSFFGVDEIFCAPKPGLKRSEIVGGKKASAGSFPYQVSIEVNDYHWCGGAIIAPDLILTAAHCTKDNKVGELTVRAGTMKHGEGGQVVKVSIIAQHKCFDWDNVDSDIALLKLATPLKFNKFVRAIKLVENTKYLSKSKPKALVSGWGHTTEDGELSDDLQYAEIPLLPKKKCASLLEKFTDNMLCAGFQEGKVDACQSDSGGPLVIKPYLIGIVSWGIGCARANTPGVYTDVVALRPWIDKQIKALNENKKFEDDSKCPKRNYYCFGFHIG